uniref:Structural protein n=3 Tax=Penaeid shrimp infectious myonecrosis virus TaxID=282786 RepID=A0A089GIB3_9VIRU|nr:structural protein [Penaeid shrimp infectious myonecrosis virus]
MSQTKNKEPVVEQQNQQTFNQKDHNALVIEHKTSATTSAQSIPVRPSRKKDDYVDMTQGNFNLILKLLPTISELQKRHILHLLREEVEGKKVCFVKREKQNPLMAINELAVKVGKKPKYTSTKTGADHIPSWTVLVEFAGFSEAATCDTVKNAKMIAAYKLVKRFCKWDPTYIEISDCMLPPPDLTSCGDVESNPGPIIHSVAFARTGSVWTPATFTFNTTSSPGRLQVQMSSSDNRYGFNSVLLAAGGTTWGTAYFSQRWNSDFGLQPDLTITVTPQLTGEELGSIYFDAVETTNAEEAIEATIINTTPIDVMVDTTAGPVPIEGDFKPTNETPTWVSNTKPIDVATPKTRDYVNRSVLTPQLITKMKDHVYALQKDEVKDVTLASLDFGLNPSSVLGRWLKWLTGIDMRLHLGKKVTNHKVRMFVQKTRFPLKTAIEELNNGTVPRRLRRDVRYIEKPFDKEEHTDILLSGDVEENPGPEGMEQVSITPEQLQMILAMQKSPPKPKIKELSEREIQLRLQGNEATRRHQRFKGEPIDPVLTREDIIRKHNQQNGILPDEKEQPVVVNNVHPLEKEYSIEKEGMVWDEEQFLTYIHDKSSSNDHYACIYNVVTHNRFGVLEMPEDPLEMIDHYEPGEEPKTKPKTKSGNKRELNDETFYRKKKTKTTKEPKTQEQKKIDHDNMFSRLLRRLDKPQIVAAWLNNRPSRKLVEKLADSKFGIGWQAKEEYTTSMVIVSGYINCEPLPLIVDKLLSVDNNYDMWQQTDKYFDNLITLCNRVSDVTYTSAQLCRDASILNNKKMHVENGNIVSMENQSEIDSQTKFFSLLEDDNKLPIVDELRVLADMTAQRSNVNTAGNHLRDNDSIRADAVLANNTVRNNCQIPIPVTTLIPRQIRGLNGVLVNQQLRLQGIETHITDSYISKAEPSDYSKQLSEMVNAQKTSTWRANNIASQGWDMFDTVQLNTNISQKDLSMDTALTKLMLLYQLTTQNLPATQLPSSIYSAFDSRTQPTLQDGIWGINNGVNIFGEQCGGLAAPVFPFSGGTGEITFHLTLQSVPQEFQESAIFVPATALQAAKEGARTLAMYVLMFAEWPFGMYTKTKQTTDNAGNNQSDQIFIHSESTVHIPGQKQMHIVLPRKVNMVNPTTIAEANARVVIQPTYGTVAAGAGVANGNINVAAVGVALPTVNLTDYLVSWATDFTLGDIKQLVERMKTTLPISRDLMAARQNAMLLSTLFPPLIQSNVASDTKEVPGTAGAYTACLANLGIPETLTVNWGVDINVQPLYQLLETDITAHNRYVLNLFKREEVVAGAYEFGWLGHMASYMMGLLLTMNISSVFNVWYSTRRISTKAWDTAYDSNIQAYQDMHYQMFSWSSMQGSIAPAMVDEILHNLCGQMFGFSLPLRQVLFNALPITFSSFGSWMLPRVSDGFQTVRYYDVGPPVINAKRDGEVPVSMIDAWTYKFTEKLPKSFLPWPMPEGKDSTMGYDPEKEPALIDNSNETGNVFRPFMARNGNNSNYLPTNYTIDVSQNGHDESCINVDLFNNVAGVTLTNYDGTATNADVVPTGSYIKQRAMPINANAVRPTETLDAANHTKPFAIEGGRLVYLGGTIANTTNVVNAMQRKQRLSKPAFKWAHAQRQRVYDSSRPGMDAITKLCARKSGFMNARSTAMMAPKTGLSAVIDQAPNTSQDLIEQPSQQEVMDMQATATV